METVASHLMVGAIGAGLMWWIDRPIRRQFRLMLDALGEGKTEGEGWRLVRDEHGDPKGFRIMYGASAATDEPSSF